MKSYIPSLNGLRAVSILIVILHHMARMNFGEARMPFPIDIFFDGSLGVNVFFVISGFLITTLLMEEERSTGTISLKGFYIRRTLRIFPAYYFLLLVYFVLQCFSILHFTTRSWLSSVFYYKYLDGQDWESGHFWSLSVEEHFYLLWPMVFFFFKRFRAFFAFGVILLVAFFRYNAYVHYFPSPMLSLDVSIFQRADAIMIGCMAAMYRDRLAPLADRVRRFAWSPLLIILLIGVLRESWINELNADHKLHLGFVLVPLGIGSATGLIPNLLVALLMLVSIPGEGKWFAFLNLPVMNYIGKLSYSLYLWQQLFFSPRLGQLSHFPLNILLIVICALFSYRFIEKPFLKLKDGFVTAGRNRHKLRVATTV